MNKVKSLLKNHSAIQAFSVLLVGFLIILTASLFIFYFYITRMRTPVNRKEFAEEFTRIVRLAHIIPPKQLRRHLGILHDRHIRLSIANKPEPNSIVVYLMRPKELINIGEKHFRQLVASILLTNGQWLIVRGRVPEYPWFMFAFIITASLLFIAWVTLCVWVISRLSLPINQFIQAAKRFGVDIQSPPMAETGSQEIREIIKSFNEMQERIRRLLHDRTQMLAAISHDLRAPITRLQLRAEYLKGTPQYEKAIADLKEMDHMISSILAFTRGYANTEVMERFDLNALLETLCNDMVDAGYAVKYIGSESRSVILGRLQALKRAFTNLIENAVKYGKHAEVSLIQQVDTLQVKINDEGPGIPESEMENVFAPFYRIDPSRSPQKSGAGLGLAVARDIIRSHGGDITLFNREPQGLTVVVTLSRYHL